jgi:hypothetical protein
VSFTARGKPVVVAHCSCRDCQRLSGAGHTTGAMFAASEIDVTGTPSRYSLKADSGSTVTRSFCGQCGSPLWGSNTNMSGFITISAGLFDEPDSFAPEVAIFARSRPSWDVIDSSVPSFDAQPG